MDTLLIQLNHAASANDGVGYGMVYCVCVDPNNSDPLNLGIVVCKCWMADMEVRVDGLGARV